MEVLREHVSSRPVQGRTDWKPEMKNGWRCLAPTGALKDQGSKRSDWSTLNPEKGRFVQTSSRLSLLKRPSHFHVYLWTMTRWICEIKLKEFKIRSRWRDRQIRTTIQFFSQRYLAVRKLPLFSPGALCSLGNSCIFTTVCQRSACFL